MRLLFIIAITFILTLAACTKSETVLLEDNGCIERSIIPVTAHSINDPDVSVVNDLFSTTGIDNNRFRYYQYVHDTFQTVNEQVVKVDQYTNGLRIFTGDLVYIFWNNSFHYRSGDITKGTSLDTLPQLKLGQIRWLFLNSIEQFDNTANKFKDSCFKAEFGYFNLNAGISYNQEDLVKAWRVTIKNSVSPSEYPIAYYRDKDGSLIYYDNGIRTFK